MELGICNFVYERGRGVKLFSQLFKMKICQRNHIERVRRPFQNRGTFFIFLVVEGNSVEYAAGSLYANKHPSHQFRDTTIYRVAIYQKAKTVQDERTLNAVDAEPQQQVRKGLKMTTMVTKSKIADENCEKKKLNYELKYRQHLIKR